MVEMHLRGRLALIKVFRKCEAGFCVMEGGDGWFSWVVGVGELE